MAKGEIPTLYCMCYQCRETKEPNRLEVFANHGARVMSVFIHSAGHHNGMSLDGAEVKALTRLLEREAKKLSD